MNVIHSFLLIKDAAVKAQNFLTLPVDYKKCKLKNLFNQIHKSPFAVAPVLPFISYLIKPPRHATTPLFTPAPYLLMHRLHVCSTGHPGDFNQTIIVLF